MKLLRPGGCELSVSILSTLLLLRTGGVSPAAAQNKGQTLSEAEAKKDADYAVQGEYIGQGESGDDEQELKEAVEAAECASLPEGAAPEGGTSR